MRRTQPHFREAEKAALLKALAECRKACIAASGQALFDRKDVGKGCQAVQTAIDDLAGILTGDKEHFWLKAHSSPPTGLPS